MKVVTVAALMKIFLHNTLLFWFHYPALQRLWLSAVAHHTKFYLPAHLVYSKVTCGISCGHSACIGAKVGAKRAAAVT